MSTKISYSNTCSWRTVFRHGAICLVWQDYHYWQVVEDAIATLKKCPLYTSFPYGKVSAKAGFTM